MKILLSCDYPFHCSGLSTLAENCFKGLTELGHEVVPHSLFDYQGTESLLKKEKFSVMLGIGYWANSECQISLPKKYGVPSCVYWVSEGNVPKYQDIIPQADKLLVTSNYSKEIFEKYVPESKPKTLYIGTDIDFYKPNPKVTPTKNFCTFVSSGEVKGCEEALTAVKVLAQKNLDYTYIVHSPFAKEYPLERNYMARLQKLSEIHNLGKWTKLVSGCKIPVSAMPSIYHTMYAYMAPIRMACFGIPLIEAGACSCPTIAGDWAPMNEIVTSDSGVLVPHGAKAITPKFQEGVWYTEEYRLVDVDLLAEKMEDFLCDPEKRDRLGRNMRKIVEEKFNLKKQVKKLEKELESLT